MLDMITSYFGMTMYPLVLIIFMIYLMRGFQSEIKKCLCCSILFFLLLLPILYNVCKAIGQGAETYRFFWLLPVSLIVAVLMTDVCRKAPGDPLVIHVMIATCIVSFGTVLFLGDTWKMPDNAYALDDEIVDVARLVNADCKGQDVRIIAEPQVMIQLRQYSGNLCWAYTGRGQMLDATDEEILDHMVDDPQYRLAMAIQQNVILNEDTLKNDMNGLKVNYVILPAESDLPSHFPVDYMNPVEHTKHYEIYKWNGF